MPGQIAPEVASERIQRLIAMQELHQRHAMERFLGQEEEVLVEGFSRRSNEAVSGKGRHGVSITLPGSADDIGNIVHVKVIEIKNNTLMAQRINKNRE